MNNSPIRILYVNGGLMNRGGIESYMMNYYRQIDRTQIQFDFLVHNGGGFGYYDDEIKSLGGKIYVLPQKSKHPFTYNKELKQILAASNYKIIHTHMDAMGAWVLKTAKQCGIPIRIAHSHNTQHLTKNSLKLLFLEFARKQINRYATHCMACSEIAGKWLFGKRDFHIVRNAIDINKFLFNNIIRNGVRKEWDIENDFVIGHIGRFDTQKNHSFLLDVFADVNKHFPNTKLILVGDGHLRNSIESQIETLKIQNAVILAGVRDDIERFYNAFDLFVLPSLFEGLPVVSIESQANGCPSLLSDQVSAEANIANKMDFLPLVKNIWIEKLSHIVEQYPQQKRKASEFDFQNSGYDIKKEVLNLQQIYLDLWRKI